MFRDAGGAEGDGEVEGDDDEPGRPMSPVEKDERGGEEGVAEGDDRAEDHGGDEDDLEAVLVLHRHAPYSFPVGVPGVVRVRVPAGVGSEFLKKGGVMGDVDEAHRHAVARVRLLLEEPGVSLRVLADVLEIDNSGVARRLLLVEPPGGRRRLARWKPSELALLAEEFDIPLEELVLPID